MYIRIKGFDGRKTAFPATIFMTEGLLSDLVKMAWKSGQPPSTR
jgi:hypothetical protein